MLKRRPNNPADVSRFQGYKGAWDKELGTFVFVSKEERDRFQIDTYGQVRNGFRELDEPEDDRPMIDRDRCRCSDCRDHEGFWKDRTERMTYEDAVEANPRRPEEGPLAYAARISGLVTERYKRAVKSMPRAHQTRRERDGTLMKLRGQADGLPSGTEDYEVIP